MTAARSGAGADAPTADRGTWLRRFDGTRAEGVRVAVLPHAGGSASGYRALSAALSADFEVVCVQYPGRQDRYREQPVSDLRELASQVAAVLRHEDDRPLALFGHSMGATLGFEVARLLERDGVPPVALFASARRAPGRPLPERVHQRDDAGLLAEMSALGGTDERVLAEPELLRLYLPVVRADYRAIETYRCPEGAVVGCPITALVGDADPRVPVEVARAWQQHTTAGFDFRVFPGGHFYLDEHTEAVARLVRDALG
ncbi:thioesterase II family protein [Kitasatospora sp. NPDC002543]